MQNKKLELIARLNEMDEKLFDKWNEETSYNWDYSADANDIKEEVWDEMKEEWKSKIEDTKVDIEDAEDIETLEGIENYIDHLEWDIEHLEIDTDLVNEKVNDYFIYYNDAYDYLQDNNITDFEDAFNNGYTDICGIATYYLGAEFWGY